MRVAIFAALLGTTALVPAAALAQADKPAQPNPNQQAGPAQQRPTAQQNQGVPASQLRNQTLHSQAGREFGRVHMVLQGRDNQVYAVVSSGDRQVLVPASRLSFESDRFIISGADDQLRFPPYNQQVSAQYKELDPNYLIIVAGYESERSTATRRAGDGTNIVVQQAAPTVRVDPADPRVVVRQAQPQVSVNQGQPEIIVRQPQPTVRVDIPQPEIIVRMPEPNVDVALAPPDVRVLMQKPEVSVQRAGEPQVQVSQSQPQVYVQRQADPQANVQVQRAEGQPQVRYEAAEARVIINQAEGQPNVRIERKEAAANQAGASSRAGWSFGVLDSDRNGTLARDEFNTFAAQVYGAWDGNRNRRVEKNEFYGGLHGLWDFDRDDRLTDAEYNRARRTWGRGLEGFEFSRFDRNRDGFLDREEFAGGWGDKGLYEQWDADQGGWLADNEFGDGLFRTWGGERGQVADKDLTPWLGYNWGVNRTAANVDTGAEPSSTGSVPGTNRTLRVTELEDKDVYSVRDQKIGEVKRVVRGRKDNRSYVVLEHGGFLGLGEKEVPLPLERVFMRGERLYAAGLSEAEINRIPDWDMNDREYRAIAGTDAIQVGVRE